MTMEKLIKQNITPAFVFIYVKCNLVQVLDIDESKINHDLLINNGWKHTSILDARKFISELCNNVPDSELRKCIESIIK